MSRQTIIGGIVTKSTGIVDGAITGVSKGADNIITGVTGGIGGAVSGITGGIGGAIGGPVGTVIGGVGGGVGSVISGVGGVAGDIVGGVGGLAGDIVGGIGGGIGSTIDGITDGLTGGLPSTDDIPVPGMGGDKDPCNRLDYLVERLGGIPILGDLSLKDIGVNLDQLAIPKIPELKLPSAGEIIDDIGNKIKGGVTDLVDDLKSGIGDALDSLSPDNLMKQAKQAIGAAGREALTNVIEDKMKDLLGPVKGGLGNQLKRSFKQNMLMAGIEEVANIISGEPNILDPCAGRGKEKIKGLTGDEISSQLGGKAVSDVKSSIDKAVDFKQLSNKQIRDLQTPVLGDVSLPGAQDLFNKQKAANDKIVEEKVEESIDSVAKETANKAVVQEEVADKEIKPEDSFAEPQLAPQGLTRMRIAYDLMYDDARWLSKGRLLYHMNAKRDEIANGFKNWEEKLGVSEPVLPALNHTMLYIDMWVQQYTRDDQYAKLPQEFFTGGVHIRAEKHGSLRMFGSSDSSDVIQDHTDSSYLTRVYKLLENNTSGPYASEYPGTYYAENMRSDTGAVTPMWYMWNPDWIQLLQSQKIPIMAHINRELTNEEVDGPMQMFRRPTLIWSTFEDCVDGLLEWMYDYKLQIPVLGTEKNFGYKGADFRMVKGVYDIPDEYCSKATLIELMDHEVAVRMDGDEVSEGIRPTRTKQAKTKNTVNRFRNNRFRR